MEPADVPQELIDLLDERAGKKHRREGVAVAALAEILTRYEQMLQRATMIANDTGTPTP